jgi:hypothetical protein
MQESLLHAQLAYLMADIEIAYARPTEAQYAVFRDLDEQTKAGQRALEAAISSATPLVGAESR